MKNVITKLTGWGIWLLISLLVVNLVKDIGRARQIKSQIEAEKAKVQKIEADNQNLEKQLAESQSPDFIEKEVRNKLGLGKEGETTVVLPDADVLRKLAPQVQTEAETLPDPNWKKWMKLFL